MFNLSFFHINKIASLSQWRAPRRSVITRSVALLISLCFLLPTISWAFDIKTYENDGSAKIRLFGPHDKRLAAEYRIPPNLGKTVEVGFAPGDLTFILVQDLHCNYEIQSNIRSMLNHLMDKHSELKLVAVEGATGIIPTMELALLPDSAVKRAVADYFMREGKLTGADCLAICDAPTMELFGAEDSRLYDKSIELIQAFGSEENRGLILELLDQLELLENRRFNQKLLVFEQRRRAFMRGDLDAEAYHHHLVQEARGLKITLLPPALRGRGAGRLDYHDQETQDRYLENKIHGRLARTAAEKRLLSHRKYVEIVERIVSVAASRKDIQAYQKQTGKFSLAGVLNLLQALPEESRYTTEEEIEALEEAAGKALKFYDLAEQRNHALLENTARRARDRGESRVILVTGGFHTPAIIELIRNQGCSYVSLRPRMEEAGQANNYFNLLRYPDQPTEFERLMAQQAAGVSAIAPLNHMVLPAFRVKFISLMKFMNKVVTQIQAHKKSSTLQWGNLTLKRIKNNIIEIISEGANPLVLRLGRQDINILYGDAARTAGQTSVLASNNMRILSLFVFGMGAIAFVLSAFLPIVAPIAVPVVGIGLIGVGIWFTAAHFKTLLQLPQTNPALFQQGIVLSAMLLPLTLLAFATGTVSAEAINTMGVGTPAPNVLLPGLTLYLQQVLSLPIFQNLTVYAHDPGMIREWIGNTLSAFSILLMTVPFSVIGQIDYTGMEKIQTVHVDTFRRKYGRDPNDYAGSIFTERLRRLDAEELGSEDLKGSHMILPENIMQKMMGVVAVNGLRGYATKFSYRFRAKDVVVSKEGPSIAKMPMLIRFMYSDPEKPSGKYKIDPVLLVSLPKFNLPGEDMDKEGFVTNELPDRWVRGVLNGFDPGKQYVLNYEEGGLKEVLYKTGQYKDFFGKRLQLGRTKWGESGTAPIRSEKNEEVFNQLTAEGILHEYTGHGLAFQIPDFIAEDTPEALLGDITEEKREAILEDIKAVRATMPETMLEELPSFSFDAFLELIHSDQELYESRSYNISLIKSLNVVKEMEDDIDITQEMAIREQAVEMFSDRFGSMFFTENAHKIQACLTVLNKEPGDNMLHLMYRLDDAKREGKLAQAIKREVSGVSDEIAEIMAKQLQEELEAAEKKHVFVKEYNEVGITETERKMYRKLLDYFIYLDEKNELLSISEIELEKNRLAEYQRTKLSDAGMGVVDKVVFQLTKNVSFKGFVTSILPHLKGTSPYNIRAISDVEEHIQPSSIRVSAGEAQKSSPIISSQKFGVKLQPAGAKTGTAENKGESVQPAQIEVGEQEPPKSKRITIKQPSLKSLVVSSSQINGGNIKGKAGGVYSRIISSAALQETVVTMPSSAPAAPTAPSPAPSAPVSPIQPMAPSSTPAAMGAADQALAFPRAGSLLPELFNQWRVDPLPPPEFWTNNPALAAAMTDLIAMQVQSGAEDWSAFQAAVEINTLTMDPTGGLIGLPAEIANGMVALIPEPGNTIQVVQYPGGIGVPVDMMAIPRSELGNSVSDSVQKIIDASNLLTQQLINGNIFENYILLTMEQAKNHQDLLGHLYLPKSVQGVVNVENTELLNKLGLQQLLAESQPLGIDLKARGIIEQVNEVLKNGLVVVYPADIGQGLEASAASLGSLATAADGMGLSSISLGPVDNMSGGSEGLEKIVNSKLNAEMPGKFKMEALVNKERTPDQYMAFVADLVSLDQALILGRGGEHGTRWEAGRIFPKSESLYEYLFHKGTRLRAQGPVKSAGERLPEDSQTKFQTSQGLVKTVSMIVLGLAAVRLILRSLGRLGRRTSLEEKFKSERLPILYVVQPEFITAFLKALRLMARIITGNVGDKVGDDPLLQQQLADLQRLTDEGIKLEDLKNQPSAIPDSLKISLNLLLWIKDSLGKLPFFNAFLKWRKIEMDGLHPELLMLVNEFMKLESVTWHFAKHAHMLRQAELQKDGLNLRLVNNLTLSEADAKTALIARSREMAQLLQTTEPARVEQTRISDLRTQVRDLSFAIKYQRTLQQMDKNFSPRLLRRLIFTLLRELSRRDISPEYRTGVLEVLSWLEPPNQEAVQISTEAGIRTITLPGMLMQTPFLLENMLFIYDLYKLDGEPVPVPAQNRILRAANAA